MNTEHTDPEDLTALRAVFGVDARGAPALGWDAVRAFEAEHGVVLPEPYRTFVAEITHASPAGPPEYGLLGPAERRGLSRPFPLTSAWLWEADPRPSEEIDPIVEQVFSNGSIVLGTDGCGMYWHLVVTGPHRGHIWNVTGEGATPFGTEFGFTTADPGFAGWISHWASGKPWFDVPLQRGEGGEPKRLT